MRGDGGNHMTDPAERTAGTDPEAGRHDQPENTAEEIAVVELTESGNNRAENGRRAGVAVGAHAATIVDGITGQGDRRELRAVDCSGTARVGVSVRRRHEVRHSDRRDDEADANRAAWLVPALRSEERRVGKECRAR